MFKIYFTISVLILFCSCDEKIYYDIPQNERPVLNDNDTVYFVDVKNNIDTFLIKLFEEYEISDKRYYNEVITIQYKNINSPKKYDFIIEQRGSTSIHVNSHYFPSIYKKDNVTSIEIDGVTYSNVYNKSGNFPDTIPNSIYYSHKQGMIRYDFSDTSYFEIKNY